MTLLRFLADWRSSRAHRAALAVARAAAARGDWAAALRACEAALASRPADADAWWLKGGLLLRMNAVQAAARAYATLAALTGSAWQPADEHDELGTIDPDSIPL